MRYFQQVVQSIVLLVLLVGCGGTNPQGTPINATQASATIAGVADQAIHERQTADAQIATASALKALTPAASATGTATPTLTPPARVETARPTAPPALPPRTRAALSIFNLPKIVKDMGKFIWRTAVQGTLAEKDWTPGAKEAGATAAYRALASTDDPKTDPYRFRVTAYAATDPAAVIQVLDRFARSTLTDVHPISRTIGVDQPGFNGLFTISGQTFDESYFHFKLVDKISVPSTSPTSGVVFELHVEGPSTTPAQRADDVKLARDLASIGIDIGASDIDALTNISESVVNPPTLLPQVGTLQQTPSGPMLPQVYFESAKARQLLADAGWVQVVFLQPTNVNDSLLNGQVGRVRFAGGVPTVVNEKTMLDTVNELFQMPSPTTATQNQIFPGMTEAVSNTTFNSQFTYVWKTKNDVNFGWFVRKRNTPNVEAANADIMRQMQTGP